MNRADTISVLRAHAGDNERWWVEWTAMAERIEGFGAAAERGGYQLTAGSYYLRAAVYYFCGERFIAPSDRKRDTYRNCLRCFCKGVARRYPGIERVEVPYDGTTLPAWFLKADVPGPAPAVVMFDGLDNAKEMSVLFGGVEIARRGIHTLYVSPLKALAVDIARNLEAPVNEMGLPVTVETRTGDTPQHKRQRQATTTALG
jgi:hypothetical protein